MDINDYLSYLTDPARFPKQESTPVVAPRMQISHTEYIYLVRALMQAASDGAAAASALDDLLKAGGVFTVSQPIFLMKELTYESLELSGRALDDGVYCLYDSEESDTGGSTIEDGALTLDGTVSAEGVLTVNAVISTDGVLTL